ncbi:MULTISPECIES: alpha/beta hydrolase [unclassified Okeania]|uniref:alpha/beta hydrolase n=1 Tax=unclassified Okeania TaxID=2634635 RepID=UPI0013BC1D1A|nr:MULTISPECIES: alpha/beta fold hydrolase [unclassified Okeania]NES74839.1 alpha/beta hydrolase [Okeania sp. SIO1H4]NET20837.1 alpha/beta hydrolase [Okeania sp. SIO1H5]NET91918.1 alpha/beta hydrolase [Okeania sp. SIO1H2]
MTIFETFLKFLLISLATIYTGAFMLLRLLQNRLIFEPAPSVLATPATVNLPYQEVWLSIPNSHKQTEKISGWWIPQTNSNSRVILFLHGAKGNMAARKNSYNLERVAKLYQLGFSVFMIDYRGYGNSKGRFPTEATVYEDALVAWNYLTQEKNFSPEEIFIYGYSLGGAVAANLCLQQPQAAGLIAEGCFTSIKDMAKYRRRIQIFPLNLLVTQKFDFIDKVKLLEMPVLFIHGTKDEIVPVDMSQRLFAAAAEPKKLLLIPNAAHDNLAQVDSDSYIATLHEFFERAINQYSSISQEFIH